MRPEIDVSFDEMVEALEENEDMVECKECFDLFPKKDCEKAEIGYVCPVCKGLRVISSDVKLPDCAVDPFDTEFPDVAEYNPKSVRDYQSEPQVSDALANLIADEYEAVDGYEVADEAVQNAELPEAEKDEILDTIDHIKEEEEEHIEELKELCPECEVPKPEPLTEAEDSEIEEPEVEEPEEISEDTPIEEEPEAAGPEENPESVELEAAYEAALAVANETKVGQVFGYAKKDTEEFVVIELLEVDDPEAIEADLMAAYDDVAYAYVAYPEIGLEESLYEDLQLNEAQVGKTREFMNWLSKKAKTTFRKHTKASVNIDEVFNKGYRLEVDGPGIKDKSKFVVSGQQVHGHRATNLKDAENLAKAAAKALKDERGMKIILRAVETEIVDENIKAFVDNQKWILAIYYGGSKTIDNIEKINKKLKSLEMANREFNASGAGLDIDFLKEEAKKGMGEKKNPILYTEKSYKKYSDAFDALLASIDDAKDAEALIKLDIPNRVTEIEELLVKLTEKKPDDDEDPKEDPEDDEGIEDTDGDLDSIAVLKKKALKLLQEGKEKPDAYTAESYAEYEAEFEKLVNKIKSFNQVKTLKEKVLPRISDILAELKELLDLKETPSSDDGDNGGSGDGDGDKVPPKEDNEELEKYKSLARKDLGDKKEPEPYTEDSYKVYSEEFDKLTALIEEADTVEKAKIIAGEIKGLKEQIEKLLVEKSSKNPEDTTDDDMEFIGLELYKELARRTLGTKKSPEPYTEESYEKYSEEFDKLVAAIDEVTVSDEAKALYNDIKNRKAKIESLLVEKSSEDSEEPEKEPEDEEVEDPKVDLEEARAKAKELLGNKKSPELYTEESYNKYSEGFDKISAAIDAADSIEKLEAVKVEENKKKIESWLEEKTSDEEDIPSETSEDLDKLKQDLADQVMDTMVDKDGYTEDSYEEYETYIQGILDKIEAAGSKEELEALDAVKDAEDAKKLLVKVPDSEEIPEEEEVPEEEEDPEDDKDPEDEKDPSGGKLKRTGKGDPINTAAYERAKKKAIQAATNMVKANLGTESKLTAGAATSGDIEAWLNKFKSFFGNKGKHRSEFVFEAFKRKVLRECGLADKEKELLSEAISQAYSTEGLQTTASAVKSVKDTASKLKSAATGLKNMTSAMREEYHSYANPAELKAMEDLEAVIAKAKSTALQAMSIDGIQATEVDGQGWMSGNNEYCDQTMIVVKGLDADEVEDVQDQLTNIFEQEIMSNYTLPAEIIDIRCSVALPDENSLYGEDEEESSGNVYGSMFVEITFARNLF